MSLDPEKCRLVSREQVQLFCELDSLLQEIRERLPRVADRSDFRGSLDATSKREEGVLPDHSRLRDNLSRTHYQVGLLGVTGASKSTSLNSLIGQTVLPQGSEGMPCTSVIQRIRFVPPETRPSLDLLFLDKTEWWKRRKMMCEQLRLAEFASEEEDEELQSRLDEQLKDAATPRNEQAMIRFFQRFLEGKRSYSHRLDAGHHLGPLSLPNLPALATALKSVASHQGAGASVPVGDVTLQDCECALLREVFISIPLESPPADLELVDLPGFLAGSGQDDVITKSYLDRLDGACFLLNTQNLGLGVFDEMRENLNRRFKTLLGRVWIVATKIDSLAEDQLSSRESSIFHGIDKAVRNWDLHEPDVIYKHLLITSNEIYKRTRGKSADSVRNIIATALKMDLDANGELPYPLPLRENANLEGVRRAFEHVLEDGGIERLRGVVQKELAVNVRHAVSESTRQTMAEIADRAIRIVEGSRDQRGLTKADHDVAIAWSNMFRSLERRKDLVDELAANSLRQLRSDFTTLLNDYCPVDNLPDAANLPTRHANFAKSLHEDAITKWLGEGTSTNGRGGVVGEVIQRLVAKVREMARPKQLEGRSKNLEAVLKPVECLHEFSNAIVHKNPKHAGQFAEVACEELFKTPWPSDISPRVYRDMMVRKIDNLMFEAAHRLQNSIRSALAEVQGRLENLGQDDESASTDPVSRETYDEFLGRLREFRKKLD